MSARDNPWLARKPFNWPHQGGAQEGPSNTIRAMSQALAAGACGLELDLHSTRDGALVVCHDKTLDRTTSGQGRIEDQDLQLVQSHDSAYWWVPGEIDDHGSRPEGDYPLRHHGTDAVPVDLRVPTLDEVLGAFPDALLNLELKAKGYEADLAAILREVPHGDVIVVSFRDSILRRFRHAAPEYATAPGIGRLSLFWLASQVGTTWPLPASTAALQVPYRWRRFSFLNRRFLRAAERAGVAVHVWTIDDPSEMAKVLDAGAHGIMTNRPAALASLIARRAAGGVG